MNKKTESLNLVYNRFDELVSILPKFRDECSEQILAAANILTKAFKGGSKVLICGNGGSAADSQHFSAEFVSSFSKKISRRALPAIALTVDTSILTAFSNDFTFDNVFARQVEAYGKKGDVLVVLTTSGESLNCINAATKSAELGLKVIAFTRKGSNISNFSDVIIGIPSTDTQHIQECHMIAYHIVTEIVESTMF